jgi:hypothetical protein
MAAALVLVLSVTKPHWKERLYTPSVRVKGSVGAPRSASSFG